MLISGASRLFVARGRPVNFRAELGDSPRATPEIPGPPRNPRAGQRIPGPSRNTPMPSRHIYGPPSPKSPGPTGIFTRRPWKSRPPPKYCWAGRESRAPPGYLRVGPEIPGR